MSRKVQDEGKTKSNPEADQEDQKTGCCHGLKSKIQSQSPMAESDQNLEGYVMYFHILLCWNNVYTIKILVLPPGPTNGSNYSKSGLSNYNLHLCYVFTE